MKSFFLLSVLVCMFSLGEARAVFFTCSDVSVTTTSTKFLDQDVDRLFLSAQLKSSGSVYLKTDAIHSGTEGQEITGKGAYYEPSKAPRDSVWLKSDSGTKTVSLCYAK